VRSEGGAESGWEAVEGDKEVKDGEIGRQIEAWNGWKVLQRWRLGFRRGCRCGGRERRVLKEELHKRRRFR